MSKKYIIELEKIGESDYMSRKHGDCDRCSKTYGTFGCCSTVSNKMIFNCEQGMYEYAWYKGRKEGFRKGYEACLSDHGFSNEVKIGDEVQCVDTKPFIVTNIGFGDDENDVWLNGIVTENGAIITRKKENCIKTGHSYPAIAKLINENDNNQNFPTEPLSEAEHSD